MPQTHIRVLEIRVPCDTLHIRRLYGGKKLKMPVKEQIASNAHLRIASMITGRIRNAMIYRLHWGVEMEERKEDWVTEKLRRRKEGYIWVPPLKLSSGCRFGYWKKVAKGKDHAKG